MVVVGSSRDRCSRSFPAFPPTVAVALCLYPGSRSYIPPCFGLALTWRVRSYDHKHTSTPTFTFLVSVSVPCFEAPR